jgi:uncharacterized protein YodC (DUF2158 family)
MSFKSGDVVKLVSGGPDMAVRCTVGDPKYAQLLEPYRVAGYSPDDFLCEWIDGRKKEHAQAYPAAMLILAPPKKAKKTEKS